jgi:D-alanine--poly(phosphoribitol) ligase subunit 1
MNNIIEYIKQTSKKFKNRIAVSEVAQKTSYEELVNLAYHISVRIGGFTNKPIGIFLPKSTNALASILASTMSGNIYCPLDTSAPIDRLEKIIDSLGEATIITNTKLLSKIQSLNIDFSKVEILNVDSVYIDELSIDFIWSKLESIFSNIIDTDPCYVIFTSGSTGVPKGVTVSHRNVLDYINWANNTYDVNEFDIIGSQAPLFFDNSTLDLYLSFSNGACFNIIPESTFIFPKKIVDYLKIENISTIFWVPSLLVTIANYDLLANLKLPALRNVLFAGEVMPAKQIKYWLQHHPNAHYSNLYGPTEITVDCTYFDVPLDWNGDVLPIGVPCSNTEILILDEMNKKAKSGELCVRGSGVALGYWRDVAKTDIAFVQNPLNSQYRDIIYRTGDLVRIEEGLIYFVGRKDHQIKHNGYRIELGEIESVVSGLDEVSACIAGYISEKKVLYMMVEIRGGGTELSLRKSLASLLPKYMIPNRIVFSNSFPVMPNGKVDRLQINNLVEEILAND